MSLIPEVLQDILVCPVCKGDLEEHEESSELGCPVCGLRYAVEDGIPNMLVDEARRIE